MEVYFVPYLLFSIVDIGIYQFHQHSTEEVALSDWIVYDMMSIG